MRRKSATKMLQEPPARDSGLVMTFSANCRSGILRDCMCSRCRTERGRPVTKESEKAAAAIAELVDQIWKVRKHLMVSEMRNTKPLSGTIED